MNVVLAVAIALVAGFTLGVLFNGRVVKAIKGIETSILTEVARVRTRVAAVEAALKGR